MEAITTDTVFAHPMRVSLEASTAEVLAQHLNECEGAQFQIIDDVIAVRFDKWRGDVTVTTCRTLARRDRTEFVIPRKAIAEVLALGPSTTK